MSDQPFIVAEITKNWRMGESASPLLCQQFEACINVNHARGYRLLSFQVTPVMTAADVLTETIIAVFERVSL